MSARQLLAGVVANTVTEMLQECALGAAAEVLLQLHDAHPTKGTAIGERHEATILAMFHRHVGHDGNASTGSHHGQDSSELPAFKNYVRLQLGAAACGERVFAEAVSFLEQEKRIVLDLLKMHGLVPRKPVGWR